MYDDHDVETFSIKYYSDHRRGDLDSYPTIAACDDCAYDLGGNLGGCAGPASEQVLFCDECGASNGSAPDATWP